LAILLGTGIKGKDVFTLSKEIIKLFKNDFDSLNLDKLSQIHGLGLAKAAQILSAIELSKRYLIKQNIKKVLGNAKSLYNLIRLFGHYELLEKIDFQKLKRLYTDTSNRLNILNQKKAIAEGDENINLLNYALEDILFKFTKTGEEELKLADELKNQLRTTREALLDNFDKKDPRFISLKEELERLFKKKNLNEVSQEEMTQNIGSLKKIHEKIKELNRQNDLLKDKYKNDMKYARVHK
jgi:type I restriction enzyme R subunit